MLPCEALWNLNFQMCFVNKEYCIIIIVIIGGGGFYNEIRG